MIIRDSREKLFTRLDLGNALIIPAMFTLLSLMSLFISIRAKEDKGHYLYALFIALYVLNDPWLYQWLYNEPFQTIASCLEGAFAGVMFIYANQFFPEPIIPADVAKVVRWRTVSKLLTWLLNPRIFWLIGFPLVAILFCGSPMLNYSTLMANLLVIIIGIGYLYVNYNRSGISSRSSVLWLFWGVTCYTMLIIFSAMLQAFTEISPFMHFLISLMRALILLSMLFLSIFFADTFDTGFVITRTIIDGSLFLTVVFVYNVAEHYLLHLLSHHLEINDAFISSMLSGVMVLLISPLHHRLEHFLQQRFKKRQPKS